MIVKIEDWRKMMEFRKAINQANLEDIKWIDENGEVIVVDPQALDEWKFTGLGNVNFPEFMLNEPADPTS